MRNASALVVLALATPAAAESHVGGGYVMGRPVAGRAGGADHALAFHVDTVVRDEIDVGVTIEGGYTPGNADESLKRFAVMPGVGFRGAVGELLVRADVLVGWQVVDGRTHLAGLPVTGTETRCVRAELTIGVDAPLSGSFALRARAGLAVDAIYPVNVDGMTRLAPLIEIAVMARL
ncbi:MAG: hypothetical protein H0T42_11715 [Deltaproteobacteria bacterium]|nr:hypothetical protein [Deltaproteobacteria bacterium]